ncbi:hypothetical protein [Cohnella thailandensis]|uniref:Uncharacterized protein n=1 Tax=Cohnella thailandensis TaxID=557557 RepID=A0A841SLA5_9BACL|nr:hypothetical protein [Cohnella thailandensis]MBB6632694.1 hypothetical protein [Cohnella thailandensis]MBP1975617.1 RNA polymerase subunit RPABC4/transcription elongation factor Spt4 [Cohnella thailandensis]
MICPACNAFVSLTPVCPACGSPAADEGKVDDWKGPYSPYSPGLPLASSDSSPADPEACLHIADCPECGNTFTHSVALWR